MAVLEARGLCKHFKGIAAVDNVSFKLDVGITGLIGPNGAGKTTLFGVIAGEMRADSGDVLLDDRSVVGQPSHKVARAGIGRTFQIPRPFGQLSIRQNVATAALVRTRARSEALRRADEVMDRLGLADKPDRLASSVGVADQKRIEMAKALATRPRVLLLDEVFSGLNPSEMDDLFDVVRAIAAGGIAVLLVEHVMRVVMQLCRGVIVVDQGRRIASGTPQEIARDEATIKAYLGAPAEVGP